MWDKLESARDWFTKQSTPVKLGIVIFVVCNYHFINLFNFKSSFCQ